MELLTLRVENLRLFAQEGISFAPRWNDVLLIAFGSCLCVSGLVLLLAGRHVSLWRRRSPDAEQEAERWDAFRRYLTDFPRLDIAAPSTLELWERYLVYGIAFGIAERVLQGAQLHMPDELHQASSIYWISPTGDLGSGPSALGISDLSSGFGSALPPHSHSRPRKETRSGEIRVRAGAATWLQVPVARSSTSTSGTSPKDPFMPPTR